MRISNLLLLLFLSIELLGQDSLKQKRLKPLLISGSAAYVGSVVALDRLWYSDFERQSFQFFNDNDEWLQLDKMGHFFSSYQISRGSYHGLKWAGVKNRKAILYGGLVSAIVLTPIEIMDGFSAEYGASTGDLIANTAGALTFISQQLVWNEIRIHVKYSFHRSDYASLRPELLGENISEEIVKDYNAHTHWLSVDLSKFNPKFPKWLNIAAGYGGTGMIYATTKQNEINGFNPQRRWLLALDLDLNEYKSKSKILNTMIFFINMVKLPAPAIEYKGNNFSLHPFYY